MYEAIVFDMDGTLLDSEKVVNSCLTQVLAEYGVAATHEQMRQGFGFTSLEMMEHLGLGGRAEEAADRWIDAIEDRIEEAQLFPGVEELLAAPFRRGIVTSELRREIQCHLPRLGIEARFECVVCADDTPNKKPHPGPLRHCLEQMGLPPDRALFVGDSPYDMLCADGAGVDFALALWGAGDTAGFDRAAHILQAPEDLLGLVKFQ